jgi:hypothetical protein
MMILGSRLAHFVPFARPGRLARTVACWGIADIARKPTGNMLLMVLSWLMPDFATARCPRGHMAKAALGPGVPSTWCRPTRKRSALFRRFPTAPNGQGGSRSAGVVTA